MPLTVTLDTPAHAARLGPAVPPATISIPLQATVTGGTASGVKFYNGSTEIATATDAGGGVWTATWTGVAANSYGIRAQATGTGEQSAQNIISVTESALPATPVVTADFEDSSFPELGKPLTQAGILSNWPYSEFIDGGRAGAAGGARITLVTDATHVRRGSKACKIELRQGDSYYISGGSYLGSYDQNGSVDANWVQWFASEQPTWRAASSYLPGQSRAAYLPTLADVPGREVYIGYSVYYEGSYSGSDYFAGINLHGGSQSEQFSHVPRYTGPTVGPGQRLLLYVTGSLNTSDKRGRCRTIPFNDDGSWYKTFDNDGSCSSTYGTDSEVVANWATLTKGVWYDYLWRYIFEDGTGGLVQLWLQKNKSGVYTQVIPALRTPTLTTYLDANSVRQSGRITPYFGIYRSRSVSATEVIYLDEIRFASTFAAAMIPGSTLAVSGTGGSVGGTAAPTNTAVPTISGTTTQGQTLTAASGTWTGSPSFMYQWQRAAADGSNPTNIAGATSSTYALTSSDAGATVRVQVTGTNAGGSVVATSTVTAVVAGVGAPANTVGTTTIGSNWNSCASGFKEGCKFTLAADSTVSKVSMYLKGGTSSANLRAIVYANSAGSPGTLKGATPQVAVAANQAAGWIDFTFSSPLSLTAGDYWLCWWAGSSSQAQIASTTGSSGASKYQAETYQTSASPAAGGTWSNSTHAASIYATYTTGVAAPANTVIPTVTGTATEGQTLTAAAGTWTGSPSFGYQWQRGTSDITGATSPTYVIQTADVGSALRVVVTGTNAGGSASANSAATAAVAAAPAAPFLLTAPQLTGSPVTGATLSTTSGGWNGAPSSYAYQWQRCDAYGASCANISGATSSSYVLTNTDAGQTVKVVVTATNATGSTDGASASTPVIASPAVTPPSNAAPPAIVGTPRVGTPVTAAAGTWYDGPDAYSYQWALCDLVGQNCVDIPGTDNQTFTPDQPQAGGTLKVKVTASNAAGIDTEGRSTAESPTTGYVRRYRSPAQGNPPAGLEGDPEHGTPATASVLGTGDNPDLLVRGSEAV